MLAYAKNIYNYIRFFSIDSPPLHFSLPIKILNSYTGRNLYTFRNSLLFAILICF